MLRLEITDFVCIVTQMPPNAIRKELIRNFVAEFAMEEISMQPFANSIMPIMITFMIGGQIQSSHLSKIATKTRNNMIQMHKIGSVLADFFTAM